jgi:MFS family permease
MEEKDRNDSRGVPHVNGGVKNDPENVSPSSEILGDEVSPIPYSVFSKWEKNLVSFLIAFASMFSPLSSFIYYPAITSMATDLHVSIELINLSITTYMIVSGIAPAIIGNLSDTVGRRPIYLGTMFIYLAANIGLALQDSYPALLILRMLQSLGSSGIAYPI